MHSARLSGWGRYPAVDCLLDEPSNADQMMAALARPGSRIARGAGRAYGDASLNACGVLGTRRLDRMLTLSDDGVLRCEAGVMLADIIERLLPRGWFAPVTPGTKFVTVGGMIASDIHGKNHGAGSFCDHVLSLDLALGDGRIVSCSREAEPELFAATCGGMGLTGVILRASFRLLAVETSKIRQQTFQAACLEEAMGLLEGSQGATYSVAWIDCLASGSSLGRSLVFLGEHARREEIPAANRSNPFARPSRRAVTVPFDFPTFAMSRWPVRAFNELYYRVHAAGSALVDLDPYFYPLDTVHDLNRVYGHRGLVQYQPVLPLAESAQGLRRLLHEISAVGDASFLAVLKRMGAQSIGLMSFPLPGYTLALDFPATAASLALLDRLDAIVREHGGRIYLAKDARMKPDMVEAGYPRLPHFREVRRRHGLTERFASAQSRRLEL
jgi:FAD/FMN-containing dehydrogenase